MSCVNLRAFAAAAAMIGALAVAPASANAAYWVGLGDSFAAGPLIPSQTLSPLGCLRSTRNYARLASAQLGVSLKDASCSGAETAEMTTPQSTYAGTNPPQLDSIAADTRVVSLQIGGNDIGFTEILDRAARRRTRSAARARTSYVRGGVDELRNRIAATAPKVAAVLDGHPGAHDRRADRRPQLRGDPALERVGLLAAGADGVGRRALRARHPARAQQDDRERRSSRARNVRLADAYTASLGKDACKGSGTRWVEPLVPGNAAAPFHPNARGMAGVTPAVVAAAR